MRNINKIKIIFLYILLALIAGCAAWTKVGGYHSVPGQYSADLPWGWMKYQGKDLLITRDGILLESIEIKRSNIKDKLEHTKKKFVEGMLVEDIAEVLIDDIISNTEFHGFELIENIPVTLSGQDAFRLIYAFHNKDGLKYKVIKYGFGYKNWIYTLAYTSTTEYYFDKYVSDFNKLIGSFKFLSVSEREEKTVIPLLPVVKEKEIIEFVELRKNGIKPEGGGNQLKFSTYAEYYRFLHRTISKAVIRPEGSGSGTINATFTLLSDGTLEDVQILEGSAEDEALREAVVKAIKDSAPFPAFPKDMKRKKEDTFTITLEFRYR